jgi:hypothetical protein
VVNDTPQLLYLLHQKAGWAPGSVWTAAENLDPIGIRYPDLLVRSELLYQLRYPGPRLEAKSMKISLNTKYTKYVTGYCKYSLAINRSVGVVIFTDF